jgi:hypothetical protein
MTLRACAAYFYNHAAGMKMISLGCMADSPNRIRSIDLHNSFTVVADELDHLRHELVVRHAGEKSVAAFKAMNETGCLKHIQDSINGNRRQPLAFLGEAVDQFVSAHRLVACRNVAEDLFA